MDWWTLGPKPVWRKRLDLPIDFRHVEADRFRDETGRDGDKIIKPQFQVTHTRLPPYAALMDVYNAINLIHQHSRTRASGADTPLHTSIEVIYNPPPASQAIM